MKYYNFNVLRHEIHLKVSVQIRKHLLIKALNKLTGYVYYIMVIMTALVYKLLEKGTLLFLIKHHVGIK